MKHLKELTSIKLPAKSSHKGQNGRLLIIGGSRLFHAASLWSLTVASRIVDLVHYSSVPENNQIIHDLKVEFRDGIVIERRDIEAYIEEDDCILIGPGMMRSVASPAESGKGKAESLTDINKMENEGIQTAALTNFLLKKYPHKQWVIDAGALQMMDVNLIPNHAILTPHRFEFQRLLQKAGDQNFQVHPSVGGSNLKSNPNEQIPKETVAHFAKEYNCIVLLKGEVDVASDGVKTQEVSGGNPGMTKGGTGDVLAGLIAALACKNDPWSATVTGSYVNKLAADALFAHVGPFFNASDLAAEIPVVMKKLLFS